MKLLTNILIAVWMFFMSTFYASMSLKLLAKLSGIEALRSSELRSFAVLVSIGFLVAFVKQAKAGKIAVIVMLGITLYFALRMLTNMLLTHNAPITGKPYPLRAYISYSVVLLVNIPLLLWQIKRYRANQRVEPTVKTPVDPVNEQGTDTAHP